METNYRMSTGETVYYTKEFGYYYIKDGFLPCSVEIND